jgi:tRNA(fMet)-specific endonuclease VapC
VRVFLTRSGKPIGPLDTLIASHAHVLDVILVTHNTRELSQIDDLRLEDWIKRSRRSELMSSVLPRKVRGR